MGYSAVVRFSGLAPECECPFELVLTETNGTSRTRLGHRFLAAAEDPVPILAEWIMLWRIPLEDAKHLVKATRALHGTLKPRYEVYGAPDRVNHRVVKPPIQRRLLALLP